MTESRKQTLSDADSQSPSETVLLVEDDDAVRAVTSRALLRFGYTVLAAEGGPQALDLLEEHGDGIDLLLTDIMMPGMNGVEVARRVVEAKPGIRVFFMSGYADQDLVRQGLLSPGTHFIQKPFTPFELVERVREVLDG
ncbi:MAG: response regulator [Gemmatimonadales bacterium]|nr:MAG: response regulator [Gemmatimonadales bacterium]